MTHVLAILGLVAALIVWALVQRASGATLEDQQDAKNVEGCDTCSLASACSATRDRQRGAPPERCDEPQAHAPG